MTKSYARQALWAAKPVFRERYPLHNDDSLLTDSNKQHRKKGKTAGISANLQMSLQILQISCPEETESKSTDCYSAKFKAVTITLCDSPSSLLLKPLVVADTASRPDRKQGQLEAAACRHNSVVSKAA